MEDDFMKRIGLSCEEIKLVRHTEQENARKLREQERKDRILELKRERKKQDREFKRQYQEYVDR